MAGFRVKQPLEQWCGLTWWETVISLGEGGAKVGVSRFQVGAASLFMLGAVPYLGMTFLFILFFALCKKYSFCCMLFSPGSKADNGVFSTINLWGLVRLGYTVHTSVTSWTTSPALHSPHWGIYSTALLPVSVDLCP